MRMLVNALRKFFAAFGYELAHASEQETRFNNFVNLAQAYERRLNDSGRPVPPDETRPKLLARLLGTPPAEAYFLVQALAASKGVRGDVCEFGVAQGETSALIANEIRSTGKTLHLFDSFEGLPKPTEKDQLKDDVHSLGSMDAYAGAMACPEDMVRARLRAVSFPPPRFVIHKGFVERVLREDANLPREVSFAYVDFDFYEPIRLALDFLHRTTAAGSVVIVDDYDHFSTGAKTAVDEFLGAAPARGALYESFVPDARYGHFIVLTRRG